MVVLRKVTQTTLIVWLILKKWKQNRNKKSTYGQGPTMSRWIAYVPIPNMWSV